MNSKHIFSNLKYKIIYVIINFIMYEFVLIIDEETGKMASASKYFEKLFINSSGGKRMLGKYY